MPGLHPSFTRMLCVASAGLAACHPSAPRNAPPSVPPSAPPGAPPSAGGSLYAGPGAVPYLEVFARGTQNYTCVFSDRGSAAWGPGVPEAILYEDDGGAVGRHFGGPTWEWTSDRSSFVGSKAVADGFASMPSPDDAGVDVPWLLLPRKTGTDAGILGTATFVQRLKTEGGMVANQPSSCDAAAADGGRTVKVPYRATYVFYRSTEARGR